MRVFLALISCAILVFAITSFAGYGEKAVAEKDSGELLKMGIEQLENKELKPALRLMDEALEADKSNVAVLPYRWQTQFMIIDRDLNEATFYGKKRLVEKYEKQIKLHRDTVAKEVTHLLNNNKWTEDILVVAMQGFDYAMPLDPNDKKWDELKKQAREALLKNYPDSEYSVSMTRNEIYEIFSLPRITIPEDAEKTWEKDKFDKAVEKQKDGLEKSVEKLEKIIADFPQNDGRDSAWSYLLVFYGSPTIYNGKNYFQDLDKFDEICERWLKSETDNAAAYYVIANYCLNFKRNTEKVEELSKKALELLNKEKPVNEFQQRNHERKRSGYTALFGRVLEMKKDYNNALAWLEAAYKYDPLQFGLLYSMGQACEKMGANDRAIEYYNRCLTIYQHDDAEKALAGICGEPSLDDYRKKLAAAKKLPMFTDVTASSGLKAGGRRMAIADYNNDGWDDILVDGNTLLRNNGNGTFIDVTFTAGIFRPEEDAKGNVEKKDISTGGGVWGDYDNDGWLDFYSFAGSNQRDYLFHNNGDGTFTNITDISGIVFDDLPTQGAAWVDVNGDGFLDLYTANYEMPGKLGAGTPDYIFMNRGNGTFERLDMKKHGIFPPDFENKCGYGVSPADYDNDGDSDIFVSNYRLNEDFLWTNDGRGYFSDMSRQLGVKGLPCATYGTVYYGHTIGSQWADFNNDGYLDLLSCNLAHPRYIEFSNKTMLYINGGPDKKWQFGDIRQRSGITYDETHSDPAVGDFDNDGNLDAYITSVYVGRKAFLYHGTGKFIEPDANIPYDNQLPEKTYDTPPMFEDVSWLTGTRYDNGWGCVWFDYDNDGDLDLLVGGGEGIRLYRNDSKLDNKWLKVKLISTTGNNAAIGAQVCVFGKVPVEKLDRPLFRRKLETGHELNYIFMRHVEGGKGTGTQNSLTQHFGLGKVVSDYEMNLLIRWPGGKLQVVRDVKANKFYEIKETDYLDEPIIKTLDFGKK